MALLQKNRLTKKKDFDLVFKKGNAVKGNFLFIKTKLNDLGVCRAGFIIPNKVINKAVNRNGIKRLFSETFRLYMSKENKGHDIIVVITRKADKEILGSDLDKLLDQMLHENLYH